MNLEARANGLRAGLAGTGIESNPYDDSRWSFELDLALDWKRGYAAGQREREIAEQEREGDIFRAPR